MLRFSRLLHRLCPVCEMSLTAEETTWCNYCKQHFFNPLHCASCGLSTPYEVDYCGECLKSPPIWHRLYALGDYQYPLTQEIQRVKYQGQFWRLTPLVNELSHLIEKPASLITSVPLHWQREWHRGFNQSERMAQLLSAELNVPYQALFQRVRSTPFQRGLDRVQRQQNLAHAFALKIKSNPLPQHIAICDDVVTTGSTVNQLCKLLLDVGVKTIDIYCLCRTYSHESG